MTQFPVWLKPAVWLTFFAVMFAIHAALRWSVYRYGAWVGFAVVATAIIAATWVDRRDAKMRQWRSGNERDATDRPTTVVNLSNKAR